MKRLKLFLSACALMISAIAYAQTDVTSTYITNADFSSTEGWTQDHSSQYWSLGNGLIGTYAVANSKTSTTDATHLATEYCLGIQCRWSTNYAAFTQTTASLPVGVYTLTYDVQNKNNSTSATYENRFKVTVGGTTYTDSKKEWMSGSSAWTTHTITFSVTEPAAATISLGYGTSSNNFASGSTPHLYVSHLSLTWTDPLKASKDALQAEIDKASLCDAKEGLADAIAAAQAVLTSATTTTELEDALAALQAADKDAVLRYENGLADATAMAPIVTSFVVNGTFTDNVNGWTCTGGFQNQARASNQNGAFTVPFFENWNGSAKVNKMYQVIENIPNGTYRLDIAAFVNTLANPNESQYVFANSDKTYLTTGDPTAYEVYTVVTNNQIEIGLEQTTATANWMGIDNVSLRYYGAGDVINDAKNAGHKLAWEEAKAAAEAAIANTDYENVTGAELTALQTEIDKAEPSTAQGYDDATAALTSATQTFVAAKAAYDAYANFLSDYLPENELTYALTEKYTAIGDAYMGEGDVVDAADATARVAAALTALRAYYESHALAENVEGAVNMTSVITNANNPTNNDGWTWTGNKNNPASNEPWTDADGTNTHSYFDGGNWGANSWTTTMSQTISLPAGKFLLTAKGRAAENVTFTMAVGENVTDLPHVGSAGNVFDRGWGDASVEFVTDGSDVTILVTATSSTIHEWFSISDFRLVRLELYTQMADADDYTAMTAAIETAEAKQLGFDEGEYAPYNNVDVIKAIATAKAIDQNVENAKDHITALTETLTNGWTANTTEEDAIFDGQFATTAANSTSGDINLPGWTKVQGIRLLVKDETVDPGLAYTDGKAAVFSWGGTTLTYGEQEGYTLPLNAHCIYELTFKASAWRDGTWPSWVSVELDGVKQEEATSVPGKINDAEGNPFRTYTYYLTPTADNSILKIYMNQHFTLADLSLKMAVAEEITISEDADFTPAKNYANVTLNRTIKADTWNTFVVPFDLSNDELKEAFGDDVAVAEFSDEAAGENVKVNFNTMETPAITANKPVLLKVSADNDHFIFNNKLIKEGDTKVAGTYVDFIGTYAASTTIEAGDYFIGSNQLWKSEGVTTIKGTRAYIDARGEQNARINLFIDGEGVETTGINEVIGKMSEVRDGSFYDLQGRKVANPSRGLYIINGHKVVIK